jgi:hypothetical protein
MTYEDGTGCSEISPLKIQTAGKYPKERIQNFVIYFLKHCLYITEESWFNSEKEQEVFLLKSSDQLRDPLSHVSSGHQGSVPMHRVAGSI